MNWNPFQSLSRVLMRFYNLLFKRKCQVPEEHEMNQTAHQILQVIHLRANLEDPTPEEQPDPAEVKYTLTTFLPILDLLRWEEGILFHPEDPGSPKLYHLEMIASELSEEQMMVLIAGRNDENLLHLPDLETLLWGTPTHQEAVERGLRRDLKNLLTGVDVGVPDWYFKEDPGACDSLLPQTVCMLDALTKERGKDAD